MSQSGRVSGANNSHFARSPQATIPRSRFNRSHGYKTTFNEGYLVPFYVDEALPGDTFSCRVTAFARMATPLVPLMDNLYMETFFFAVPNRLVWNNWEKFNGAQDNPGDSTSYVVPTATSPVGGYLNGSLQDYMGLPVQVAGVTHSNFWCRAYNLIYNTWFRDENLQNSVMVDKGDGPDTYSNYVLLRRGKRYDYFTSCLPFPQKGTAVSLPLGTSAPVVSSGAIPVFAPSSGVGYGNGSLFQVSGNLQVQSATPAGNGNAIFTNTTGLITDLSTATAATINQLRQAFQIQKLLERDARGGTRYTEIIRSHFGVISPDMRLQRPEYLGGGSSPVNIVPVAQTSAASSQPTPQGNLAAFATSHIYNHGFTKSFTEHMLIIGLVCVRADLNYQQGLNRMFSRSTRYDYYWPAFSHIGEQAVLNKEIYSQGTAGGSADDSVFGYQERYAEYRYKPSNITGQFRSNFATPLDSWHLAQNFTSLPVLNSTFIQENAPMSRVLAVTNYPHFIFDSHIELHCARPMPVYSVPGLIDHF